VREAVEIADRFGGDVEAELGRIVGDEDVAAEVSGGSLTDPEDAAAFVEGSGAACLAVSIGNVHGKYREPPRLDWEVLEKIGSAVEVPLALHGASGISDSDVQYAVGHGIAKVNVNTELRERYFDVTADRLTETQDGLRLHELNLEQASAVAEAVRAKLDIPADPRRAVERPQRLAGPSSWSGLAGQGSCARPEFRVSRCRRAPPVEAVFPLGRAKSTSDLGLSPAK
jgi:fructose/tagatose bisphosphate aldolase